MNLAARIQRSVDDLREKQVEEAWISVRHAPTQQVILKILHDELAQAPPEARGPLEAVIARVVQEDGRRLPEFQARRMAERVSQAWDLAVAENAARREE